MNRLLLLFLLSLFAINNHAKDLMVGVENIDYYPIYSVKGGQYQGYARDLIDHFAETYGHTVSYKPLPIKRLFREFLSEKIDLKFPDNKYWAGDEKKGKNIVYSDAALEYIDGALVIPGRLGQDKSNIKKLGVIRGFTPWEYLDDINKGDIKTQENNKLSQLMKMAQSNRVDAVYFNILVARYFLKHSDFDKNLVMYDDSLPHTQNYYYLSSIKHPDVIAQFNEYLQQENIFVNELKKKYELEL
jgi:polar amino acid transport system substrate-binding protein